MVSLRVHLSCHLPRAISSENGRTKGGGGSGAPEGIQGPRYPAPPADTFGFSPSHRRRPRDPGPAQGAAASLRLPVRLCVCLCVCLAVSELASTSRTKPPQHLHPAKTRPFPMAGKWALGWGVSVIPTPHGLGLWVSNTSSRNVLRLAAWALPSSRVATALLPYPIFLRLFPSHFPRCLPVLGLRNKWGSRVPF